MSNWTDADEHNYQSMSARRMVVMAARHERLDGVILSLREVLLQPPSLPGDPSLAERTREAFINRAEELRDALDPWDSGERVAAAPGPVPPSSWATG